MGWRAMVKGREPGPAGTKGLPGFPQLRPVSGLQPDAGHHPQGCAASGQPLMRQLITGCDVREVDKCRAVGESSPEGHKHSTFPPAPWDFRKTKAFLSFPMMLKIFFFPS